MTVTLDRTIINAYGTKLFDWKYFIEFGGINLKGMTFSRGQGCDYLTLGHDWKISLPLRDEPGAEIVVSNFYLRSTWRFVPSDLQHAIDLVVFENSRLK
jgi:hypothetical protein